MLSIQDISSQDQLILITDKQEILSIGVSIGQDTSVFGCLFVEVLDGDYGRVYGCTASVPYLGKFITLIN